MKIRVVHNGQTFTITEGSDSGYTLVIRTELPNTKKGHKEKHLYYPSLEQVATKLVWFGIPSAIIEQVVRDRATEARKIQLLLESMEEQ